MKTFRLKMKEKCASLVGSAKTEGLRLGMVQIEGGVELEFSWICQFEEGGCILMGRLLWCWNKGEGCCILLEVKMLL